MVISQHGDDLCHGLAFLVLLSDGQGFPKDDDARLFPFAHSAASLLRLFEGEVFARLAQQELVKDGIGFAGGAGISAVADAGPRFLPGDDPLFQFLKDAFGDDLKDVDGHGQPPVPYR